ncbi:MAG: hypothetical protein IJH63_10220 [Methanobrevibacter sp.]|nr:hypothetical protein [Methanosphaera sp.]MBR0371074.1 hypothetical protein [Methanobrevibacter sp.]
MWIKYPDAEKSTYVKATEILDINQGLNIIGRQVKTPYLTLILVCENGLQITCKPHKTDYREWLSMLKLSRRAINTLPL